MGTTKGPIDFIEEPFEVEIKRGTAILTWPSGLRRAVPMDVFREEHLRAGEALAKYDGGNVLRFPKKRPAKRRDKV